LRRNDETLGSLVENQMVSLAIRWTTDSKVLGGQKIVEHQTELTDLLTIFLYFILC